MEKHFPARILDFPDKKIIIITETEWENNYRAYACTKEPGTVEWIRKVGCHGTFYDIGANVGSYSLIAASLMAEGSFVVAFEPVFYNFNRLIENILINKLSHKIVPLSIALANRNMAVPVRFSDITDIGRTAQAVGGEEGDLYSYALCLTLDSLIETGALPFPNHVKIDVDGDELVILKGGVKTLGDQRVQSIMIELDRRADDLYERTFRYFLDLGFNFHMEYKLISQEPIYNVLFFKEQALFEKFKASQPQEGKSDEL